MASTPQTLATTSAFEILGPVMVGPSSSHTAGALRCAQVAASLLEGRIVQAHFTLWNSFAHTYRGHGTDRALVAGILGLDTDDERIKDAFELADIHGMEYSFTIAGDDGSIHPNTVDIDMVDDRGSKAQVRGESLGGGKMRITRINGVGVDISGMYSTLFVSHRDAPGALASLTALLANADVNIAFCRTYRTEQGGRAYTVFETDGTPAESVLPLVQELGVVDHATYIKLPGSASTLSPGVSTKELFDDGQQLLQACEDMGLTIGGVMAERERRLLGAEHSTASMKRVLEVMKCETTSPIASPRSSLGGFIGGEAKRVAEEGFARYAAPLMGSVQTQAVARAMAVLERSAAMGVIVAAPTAGSAGVVPGRDSSPGREPGPWGRRNTGSPVLRRRRGADPHHVRLRRRSGGRMPGRGGSAAAMAAAALVQMLKGTPKQALDAASIALSNLLGLVCDPVGGLVEVPCQNRNAIGVACAFSSAQLALSNIESLVPFDEMTKVMLAVGYAMPSSLRETAKGGVAIAPSALSACARCGACA